MSPDPTEPRGFVAEATVDIDASAECVWAALTDPTEIKKYMLASNVTSDWEPGSSITWEGDYQGKPYRDHGEILDIEPPTLLRMSHFSPLAGKPDVPESYHILTYRLQPTNGGCTVTIAQDNDDTEAASEHSKRTWTLMLEALKTTVESTP